MMDLQKKFNLKIRNFVDSQYKKINVKSGDINYYFRCHRIATHYAIKNNDKKLALVMYRNLFDVRPNIHFINYHNKEFIDNTLGEWSNEYEYRFIRWIHKNEFFDTNQILSDTREIFRNKASLIEKLFCKIDV